MVIQNARPCKECLCVYDTLFLSDKMVSKTLTNVSHLQAHFTISQTTLTGQLDLKTHLQNTLKNYKSALMCREKPSTILSAERKYFSDFTKSTKYVATFSKSKRNIFSDFRNSTKYAASCY